MNTRWRVAVLFAIVLQFPASIATAEAPPANDALADASVVLALPFQATASTAGATSSQEDTAGGCKVPVASTIWYRVDREEKGELRAALSDADFSAVLAVAHTNGEGVTTTSCRGDEPGESASVVLSRGSGSYLVMVGSTDQTSGKAKLTLDWLPPLTWSWVASDLYTWSATTGRISTKVTTTCSRPAGLRAVGHVTQEQPSGVVRGTLDMLVTCGPQAAATSISFVPPDGQRLLPGRARVKWTVYSCDDTFCFGLGVAERDTIVVVPGQLTRVSLLRTQTSI